MPAPGVVFPAEHSWPVTLRSGGLVMRPLRRRDQAAFDHVRARNASWLQEWDATTPLAGASLLSSFAQMVRSHNMSARAEVSLPLAMCWDEAWPERSRPRHWPIIGQVNVSGIVWGAANMGHIGYWIDEAYAGRGLMPTAVALVSDYCFEVMKLHRLEINIRPENAASLRVVEKLGYRPEGLRPRYLHINHDWRDHLSFAMTDDEVPPGGVLKRYLDSR